MNDTLAQAHLGTEETLLTILAHRHPDLMQRRMLSRVGLRLRTLSGIRWWELPKTFLASLVDADGRRFKSKL